MIEDYQGLSRSNGLRSSLHYASTPTLNSAGNSSVDENCSTSGSSDYWDNSTASSTEDYGGIAPTRIFIPNPNRNKSTRRKPLKKKSESSQSSSLARTDARVSSSTQDLRSICERTHSSASSSSSNLAKFEVRVTPFDISAVDACLRGHRTRVFVCKSMANLYTCPKASTATTTTTATTPWTLTFTGIPALILDPGSTKSRSKRQIQIVLVEKGTGFILWSDIVDNLTKYTRQGGPFHTMHLSVDHSRRVGLSFDDVDAADQFYDHLLRLTSDPANIALSGPRTASKKSSGQIGQSEADGKSRQKYKPPSKSEISQPCGFQHLVKVTQTDFEKYFSLQAFVTTKTQPNSPAASNNNNNNVQFKRATSIRSFPKNPAPPPPPQRSTSASCHDLTVS